MYTMTLSILVAMATLFKCQNDQASDNALYIRRLVSSIAPDMVPIPAYFVKAYLQNNFIENVHKNPTQSTPSYFAGHINLTFLILHVYLYKLKRCDYFQSLFIFHSVEHLNMKKAPHFKMQIMIISRCGFHEV